MRVTIENPPYFKLVHHKSGIKFNTWNCTYIEYDDEKFEKIVDKKQKTLF